MREIKISHNNFIIVDLEDYERLKNFHWWIGNKRGNPFIASNGKSDGIHKRIYDFIIKRDAKKDVVEYINGNIFDNRKSNLRVVPRMGNHKISSKKVYKANCNYKGVTFLGNAYNACIIVDGKKTYLGRYKTAEEAARVYDAIAIEYFGEEAVTNESLGLYSIV